MKITKTPLYSIVEIEYINPILLLPTSQGSFFPDQLYIYIYMVCVTIVVMMQSWSSYLIVQFPLSVCYILI